ncbi:MAG TPA: MAPEG family protein [Phenylobacterium sp.]|jgi:uncharacterized membrane protein YecN with MAPEG domain|nr:MAPEG family protein [Phenylobacterium sp.]
MDTTASAHAAALWVGLHLILLLVLSLLVVRQRRAHGVVLGDADIPALTQAVRAFGNATEYVPAGLIAIAVLAMVGAPPMVVHLTGLLLLVGRVGHAIGLSRSGGASVLRSAGVILTWLAYILGGVALIFYAIP